MRGLTKRGRKEPAMAATETKREAVPGKQYLEELEEIREQGTEGRPLRERPLPRSFEEVAESRRQSGLGNGIGLPKTNIERYLRVADANTRRNQLRKTIDEAGQDIFSGKYPAHAELDRIVSREFGITDEEMDAAKKREPSASNLVSNGWYMWTLRQSPWPFGIGTALVSEGEKLNPKRREWTLREMDTLRELYQSWGMPNVANAMLRDDIHAEVDVEHSNLDADTIRDYVDTPEWQEGFRKVFTLRIHQIQQWRL